MNCTRFRARGEIERNGMAEDVAELFFPSRIYDLGRGLNSPIDTQHFEVGSRKFVNQLLSKPKPEAKVLFERYVESYRQCFNQNKGEGAEKARAICAKKTVGTF